MAQAIYRQESSDRQQLHRQSIALGLLLCGSLLALVLFETSTLFYPIVGVCLLLVGILLSASPVLGTQIVVFTFPFLVGMPRGAFVPGLKVDEVLIVLCLVAYLSRPSRVQLQFTKIDYIYFVLFLSGVLMPGLGNLVRGQVPSLTEAIALLKPYMLYRLIVMTITDRAQVSRALTLLLVPAIIVMLIALLQLLNLGGTRSFLQTYYSEISATLLETRTNTPRATSTFSNWNALGCYGALSGCLCLALLRGRGGLANLWLPMVALIASIGILMLAGSSSSIVGFLVGGAVWWMLIPKKQGLLLRLIPVALILIITLGGLFTVAGADVIVGQIERQMNDTALDRVSGETYETNGIPQSVIGRVLLASYLGELILDDGIAIVTGFGAIPETLFLLPWGTAESGYMSMIFFYGPLFFVVYCVLLVAIYSGAQRLRRKLGNNDDLGSVLATAAILMVCAMGVMNIISSYYSSAGPSHYFWTIIACTAVMQRLTTTDKQSEPVLNGVH